MPPRKFTILLFPEGADSVRRFRVGPLLSLVLVGLCCAGILLGILGVLELRNGLSQRLAIGRLQEDNAKLAAHLMELSSEMEGMRRELVILAQNDARVRTLAKLPPEDEGRLGIGGASLDGALDIDAVITGLQAEMEARRRSQMEIQAMLTEQNSLERATPQGRPVVDGAFSSSFGYRDSPFGGGRKMHEGLDISAPAGSEIRATADGVVSRAAFDPGYGNFVVVEHGYGFRTLYAHNSRNLVKVGQRVKRGEAIARVGNTGLSTGPHVHYEVHVKGHPKNPSAYL